MLGFIKRWSKEFDDLEYSSPFVVVNSDRVGAVEKNLILFAEGHINWNATPILTPYCSTIFAMSLLSLANCRTMVGIVFICWPIRFTKTSYP